MGEVIPNQVFVAGYSKSRIQGSKDIKEMFKEFGVISDIVYKGPYAFVVIIYKINFTIRRSIQSFKPKVQ